MNNNLIKNKNKFDISIKKSINFISNLKDNKSIPINKYQFNVNSNFDFIDYLNN